MMFRKSGIRKSGNRGLGIRESVDQGSGIRDQELCQRHPFGRESGISNSTPLCRQPVLQKSVRRYQHFNTSTPQHLNTSTPQHLNTSTPQHIKRVIRGVLALFIIIPNFALAQKLGHIDSEYVLNKMPEYAEKKGEIDQLAKDYQKEVQALLSEVEAMRADLRAKEVLYTAEMKKEREVEIEKKAQEALEKQTKFFGFEGLLFKKQEELLKPFLQKLWEAVESVARQKKLDYILDKASDVGIIYSNPVHDYTEYVLEELGLLEKEN